MNSLLLLDFSLSFDGLSLDDNSLLDSLDGLDAAGCSDHSFSGFCHDSHGGWLNDLTLLDDSGFQDGSFADNLLWFWMSNMLDLLDDSLGLSDYSLHFLCNCLGTFNVSDGLSDVLSSAGSLLNNHWFDNLLLISSWDCNLGSLSFDDFGHSLWLY